MNNNSTILIIDDDEISLLIMQNAFEMEGYTVITTTNSLKADALFKEHKPDVVVLDVFMPDKDGFEVIRDIRKVSEDCLVVAISSNEGYLPTIKALGATLALHKTTMPEEIVEAVKALD
ncbi:MAG: response regulator [Methylococcales bacterium]|nr:response regulator [Methylococcales bacterium]